MGYRLRHWRSESGKTKQGCVYVCLSLQMSIETCSALFAWNGLHLCMHDCSHLAYKALIGFEAFICSLPSWVHSLLWDLWDLIICRGPVGQRSPREEKKSKRGQLHIRLCLIAGWTHSVRLHRRVFDCISIAVYCIRKEGLRQSIPPVLLWFRLKAWLI